MKKMGKEWHSEVDDGDGAVGGGPTRQSLRASLRTEGSTHDIHWASLFPGINILLIIRSITESMLLSHLDRMFEFYYAYVGFSRPTRPYVPEKGKGAALVSSRGPGSLVLLVLERGIQTLGCALRQVRSLDELGELHCAPSYQDPATEHRTWLGNVPPSAADNCSPACLSIAIVHVEVIYSRSDHCSGWRLERAWSGRSSWSIFASQAPSF
jgi:hypothetical protein